MSVIFQTRVGRNSRSAATEAMLQRIAYPEHLLWYPEPYRTSHLNHGVPGEGALKGVSGEEQVERAGSPAVLQQEGKPVHRIEEGISGQKLCT